MLFGSFRVTRILQGSALVLAAALALQAWLLAGPLVLVVALLYLTLPLVCVLKPELLIVLPEEADTLRAQRWLFSGGLLFLCLPLLAELFL